MKETDSLEIEENIKKRNFEVIGKQKTLFGSSIDLLEFKGLENKRKLKKEILDKFNNQMYRSIIKTEGLSLSKVDDFKRLEKSEEYKKLGEVEKTYQRMNQRSKKTRLTLSIFPELITSIYTLLLTKENEKVFDSFAGHNSRASTVLGLKRKYIGYDVHPFAVNFTKESIKNFNEEDYKIHTSSSENVDYPDESFDFSITCPPYHNIEEYNKIYEEDSVGDLSNIKGYEDFLRIYKKCIKETHRVLKKNRFFVVVVGNYYKNKKMINLMADTLKIGEEVGFLTHDINIYNRKSNIGGDMNYKLFINNLKRFPCIHEYIIIFKKKGGINE